jgi:CRISPR type III-B/RAMP module RAMP protein Cmr1
MKKICLEIETVTPAFIHVEPEGDALWRAAPFRGLARWWFRALVGASLDKDAVREREAEVLGTAQQPSAVVLRVFPSSPPRILAEDVNPGGGRTAKRKALASGQRAEIELRAAPWAGEEQLHQAYVAVWAALHLGGVGQRARRGAGSILVRACDADHGLPAPVSMADPQAYAAALADGLSKCRRVLGLSSERHDLPGFPVLHSAHATVGVGWLPPAESPRHSVMKLRRDLHRLPPDQKGEHHGEMEFGDVRPRLSSPLWVRVAGLRDGHALAVVSLFRYRLPTRQPPDWNQAQKYIDRLRDRAVVELR